MDKSLEPVRTSAGETLMMHPTLFMCVLRVLANFVFPTSTTSTLPFSHPAKRIEPRLLNLMAVRGTYLKGHLRQARRQTFWLQRQHSFSRPIPNIPEGVESRQLQKQLLTTPSASSTEFGWTLRKPSTLPRSFSAFSFICWHWWLTERELGWGWGSAKESILEGDSRRLRWEEPEVVEAESEQQLRGGGTGWRVGRQRSAREGASLFILILLFEIHFNCRSFQSPYNNYAPSLSSQASPHLVQVQFRVGTGRRGRGTRLVALQGGLECALLVLPVQVLLLSPAFFLPPRRKHPLLPLLEVHGHPSLPALPVSLLQLLALSLFGFKQMGEGLLVESFGQLAARRLELPGRRELPMRVASASEGVVSG